MYFPDCLSSVSRCRIPLQSQHQPLHPGFPRSCGGLSLCRWLHSFTWTADRCFWGWLWPLWRRLARWPVSRVCVKRSIYHCAGVNSLGGDFLKINSVCCLYCAVFSDIQSPCPVLAVQVIWWASQEWEHTASDSPQRNMTCTASLINYMVNTQVEVDTFSIKHIVLPIINPMGYVLRQFLLRTSLSISPLLGCMQRFRKNLQVR